jgi:alkylation response protein AidB-like acyl-CoA dehydrogenase
MIFKTQQEYENWLKSIKEFMWRELAPFVEEIEEKDRIPEKVFQMIREKRLLGCVVPEKYGGLGLNSTQYIPILVEISKIHGGIRLIIHCQNSGSHIFEEATGGQKERYYPSLATGDIYIAFALTEPDSGTGRDIKTTATRDGKNYIINGTKHLISFCDIAELTAVVCYTNKELGANGISVILVPKGAPGFSWEPNQPLMGSKGSIHGRLTFKNCVVPTENLIGSEEGKGLDQALHTIAVSRVMIAATSLGAAERAFELSLDYAKRRVTFGKPIATREMVRTYLADMAINIYALRQMIADAAHKLDAGKRVTVEASMCKVFGLEMVRHVTESAILIHGGIGYTRAYPVEQLHRDCWLNSLEEGTPTIQRLVIARSFLDGYDLGSWL